MVMLRNCCALESTVLQSPMCAFHLAHVHLVEDLSLTSRVGLVYHNLLERYLEMTQSCSNRKRTFSAASKLSRLTLSTRQLRSISSSRPQSFRSCPNLRWSHRPLQKLRSPDHCNHHRRTEENTLAVSNNHCWKPFSPRHGPLPAYSLLYVELLDLFGAAESLAEYHLTTNRPIRNRWNPML